MKNKNLEKTNDENTNLKQQIQNLDEQLKKSTSEKKLKENEIETLQKEKLEREKVEKRRKR